jgi:hypothetical protein
MSETVEEGGKALESETPPRRKLVGKPFQKGVSGNPTGRVRTEPRVRRYARSFDRAMVKVLAELAQDPKVPPSERRRAAMDLIAVGSGRPALVQEIAGRDGAPVGPLVALNFGMEQGQPLTPEQAYKLMCEKVIPADPNHPAFKRPAIEQQPSETTEKSEEA